MQWLAKIKINPQFKKYHYRCYKLTAVTRHNFSILGKILRTRYRKQIDTTPPPIFKEPYKESFHSRNFLPPRECPQFFSFGTERCLPGVLKIYGTRGVASIRIFKYFLIFSEILVCIIYILLFVCKYIRRFIRIIFFTQIIQISNYKFAIPLFAYSFVSKLYICHTLIQPTNFRLTYCYRQDLIEVKLGLRP